MTVTQTETDPQVDKALLRDTLGVILLDRSGSMSTMKPQAIESMNSFFKEQRQNPQGLRLALMTFDDQSIDIVYDSLPVDKIPDLTGENLIPRGATPLLDSVARAISYADQHKTNEEQVMIIVLTDGLENASHEYDTQKMRELIKQKEEDGWAFVYLGANQDAWAVSRDFGIAFAGSATFDNASVPQAMAYASSSMSSYRTSGAAVQDSVDFTKEDDDQTVPKAKVKRDLP